VQQPADLCATESICAPGGRIEKPASVPAYYDRDAPLTLAEATIDELIVELGVRVAELRLLNDPRGAHVEILEPYTSVAPDVDVDELPCIKPSMLKVNGVDVGLIARDSLHVDPGMDGGGPASLTLTLYPRSITIKAV
jgi:hypothetical protein